VLSLLGNFDIDAGITYLDNEPLGRVTSVPLYDERYQLITAMGNPYSDRDKVTWAELSSLPLCLLTPDMQNRRIIDQHLAEAGVQVRPTLESNSMIVLFSPYPHRQMVVDHAAQPCGNIRLFRADPGHPDRRAGRQPHGRPGGDAARTAHAAGLGAAGRGNGAGGRFPRQPSSAKRNAIVKRNDRKFLSSNETALLILFSGFRGAFV
jgi:DNA-binding transcriptional LysR family regulator